MRMNTRHPLTNLHNSIRFRSVQWNYSSGNNYGDPNAYEKSDLGDDWWGDDGVGNKGSWVPKERLTLASTTYSLAWLNPENVKSNTSNLLVVGVDAVRSAGQDHVVVAKVGDQE